MQIHIHVHHHDRETIEAVRELREEMRILFHKQEYEMSVTKEQVLAKLAASDAAITKVGTETAALVAQVSALQDQIANAGDAVPSEISDAVDKLAAKIVAVDELVPDTAPTEPAPAEGGPVEGGETTTG